MKKLFLIALFAVSGFAFAHCGKCGAGETKKCDKADGSQCSSKDSHHHDSTENSNEAEESKADAEVKDNSEQ
ncbi:MAG: hypothetical protein OXK80_04340 [Bdellovibrionales bacterium]|nr:hypothetical protein [Bdellovibrionales bacterium]